MNVFYNVGTSLYIPPPPPPPPPPPIMDPMANRIKKVKAEQTKRTHMGGPASGHSLDEIRRKATSMKENRENASDVDGRLVNPEDIIDQKIKKAAELRAVPKEQRLKLAYQNELQGV